MLDVVESQSGQFEWIDALKPSYFADDWRVLNSAPWLTLTLLQSNPLDCLDLAVADDVAAVVVDGDAVAGDVVVDAGPDASVPVAASGTMPTGWMVLLVQRALLASRAFHVPPLIVP